MIHIKNNQSIRITILVFVILILSIVVVNNYLLIKDQHNKQIQLCTQSVSNCINTYIENVEHKLYESLSTSNKNEKIINKLNNLGILLLDSNCTNLEIVTVQQTDNCKLPIHTLHCMNHELWINSQTTIHEKNYTYSFRFKNLQEYIANFSNSIIIVHSLNSSHFDSYNSDCQLNEFTTIHNTKLTNLSGTYDIIPAFKLATTTNQSIGYCYIGIDIAPISRTILNANAQNIASIFLIIFIIISYYLFYSKKQKNTSLNIDNLFHIVDFKQIISSSSEGIIVIDIKFRIVFVNRAFTTITGISHDQAINQKCYNCYKSVKCHTADCPLERGKFSTTECIETMLNCDGQKQNYMFVTSPLFNKNGKLVGIIERFKPLSNNYEITDRIQRYEHLLEDFIDSLPIGVYIEEGLTHRILYQNTYLNNITGGQNINSFVNETKLTTKAYHEENQIKLIDIYKTQRYFNFHKFKFLNIDRKLQIGGLLVDITQRKDVENIRDVLMKTIENLPICIAILSQQNEFEYVNPEFEKLSGYKIEDIYGINILSLNLESQDCSNSIATAIDRARSNEHLHSELIIKNRHGNKTWINASFVPITDSNGKVQHMACILEDITYQKEREKEILVAKKQAEESDKLKSSFLSNLSHEIRTPLNAIIGFASLLSDNDLSSNERNNLSDIIYRNSNELLHIIENIIEISEIESNQISISKRSFSINSLLNDIYMETLYNEHKSSNVKLSLKMPNNDLALLSDQTRLKQVVNHILSNACKFTENGFIEFGYTPKNKNTLLFYVIDSGIGIEPEKIELIFNPFRQADESSTRKFGGMGLGLAISKHIIQKLGGKIWINSSLGSGTSVYFTIPYITNEQKFEVSDTQPSTTFSWNNKTILFADDRDFNYTYFKSALKHTNAQILWAHNGNEAISIVRNNPDIDIILMDLVMPEIDGFEATRTIKSFNHNIPIIAQTAYPSTQNRTAAMECGFDSILEKPIKANSMIMEISKFIN